MKSAFEVKRKKEKVGIKNKEKLPEVMSHVKEQGKEKQKKK